MENKDKEFKLLDFITVFKQRKKIVLLGGLIGLCLGITYAFYIVKPEFLSSATVKTTTKSSGLSGLLGGAAAGLGDFGDIGDIAGGAAGGSAKEMALYENILFSRRCLEETIVKFNLMEEWKIEYMSDAVKNFRTNILDIKKDKVAGTMEIGVFDTDKQRAKDITEFLVDQLNKINIDLNVLNAKNNREFLEARYNLVKLDLAKAEDSLKIFQDAYGLAPDLVLKVLTQGNLQLETDIKSEEVKLDILKKMLNSDQAEVKIQEEKISSLKKQLNELTQTPSLPGELKIKGAPSVVLNFVRLQRAVEIQNKILAFVLPLYEQAKVEEKKEMPSVILLDKPNFPDKKSRPKRSIIVLVFLLLGFFGTYAFVFTKKIYKDKLLSS